ncbi:carboxylesterase/lipase family protein [Sphingomonas montana]|uniref:carboxylesterase/lipase family protein n=1 Tax=Sphingomonas montana TaxID=1843236 RepID=UPI00096EAEE1|nr:carboxylesterase family protein [Sphingomonas montana]
MTTRRTILTGTAAATLAALLPAATRAAARDTLVRTSAGAWRGTVEDGLHVFRGVRYGQDTRTTRFQPPRAPLPARAIADATRFALSAPQAKAPNAVSEDCLFLNIWTPGPDARAKRPVLLYIHGGAYANGSVVDPQNDGRHLAAGGDAVVVTVNHRLNAFGYLYLARLSERFADSGNAGQLDLILALRWVRDNIAAFGGDPAQVMVFGQSGGGAKIATLMGTPAAAGLFRAAATMSGQQVTASGPQNATRRARAYLDQLKVSDPEALLDLPMERLLDALSAHDPIQTGGVYFGPVLDDRALLRHPFWPDAHPQSNGIPLILGNTHDETRGFFDSARAPLLGLDWSNLADRMGPELRVDILPETVVAAYRGWMPAASPADIFFAATTAGRSWRGQIEEAEARARAGVPAWVYQLDFPAPLAPAKGAFHTLDIALVFGTLDAPGSLTGTGPDARRVSAAMQAAFLAHARGHSPGWPAYTLDRRTTMLFDARSRPVEDPRRDQRLLFAKVPYIQPGS